MKHGCKTLTELCRVAARVALVLVGFVAADAQTVQVAPLLPSGSAGVATAPGTATITGAQGQGKGTITVTLPSTLPIRDCPGPPVVRGACLGPATATITHTLSGFGRFLITTSQDGVKPTQVGNTQIQQCPVPQTTAASFTCVFDWLPYFNSSQLTTQIKFSILTTNDNFVEANYSVDFQWGPAGSNVCPAPGAAGDKGGAAPRLVACTDEISIDLALPNPAANPVAAVADELPAFCATGKFSLTEKGDRKAKIVLTVVDEKDRILSRSEPFNVFSPGKDQEWGAGCLNAQFVTQAKAFKQLQGELLWPFDQAALFQEPADKVLGTVKLYASLADAVTGLPIARSKPVEYNIIPGGKLLSRKFRSDNTVLPPDAALPSGDIFDDSKGTRTFGVPFPVVVALAAGVASADSKRYKAVYLDAEVDFPGDAAKLDVQFSAFRYDGTSVAVALTATPAPLKKGANSVSVKITGNLPPSITSLIIEPVIVLPNEQRIFFPEIQLLLNSISIESISPDNKLCSPERRDQCFDSDATGDIDVKVQLAAAPVQPTGTVTSKRIAIGAGLKTDGPHTINGVTFEKGKPTLFTHEFKAEAFLPSIKSYTILYNLGNCATPPVAGCAAAVETYRNYLSRAVQEGGGAGSSLLRGLQGAGQNAISNIRSVGTTPVLNKLDGTLNAPRQNNRLDGALNAPRQNDAQAVEPELLWLTESWQFMPTFARGAGFSAVIALPYSEDIFPDDPNFNESKIQIVSVDASGELHVYATTLDMTKKEATARIDALDPYYGLAIVGPFSHAPLMVASAASGYAIVNAGAQSARVPLANVASDGEGAVASSTLSAGNSTRGATDGWVKAWADSASVAAASWQENGKLLAVAPGTKPEQNFLVPGLEYTSRKTAELHLANPASIEAEVTVTLVKSDGSAQGRYSVTMGPNGSLRAPIQSLFPALPQGFAGYALIRSKVPIVASALAKTALALSFIAAQPLNSSTLAVTGRYAMLVADANVTGALHLVNTGKGGVRVTLRARAANGSSLGAEAGVLLAAGQQYTRSLDDQFNMAGVASVVMSSSAPGVLGDLVSADSSFASAYSVSIPFTDDAGANVNAILPYTVGQTVVPVFNPGTATASVTVTPYSAGGAAGAAGSAAVPAGGMALIAVQGSGYSVVRSSAPVVAAALVTSAAGGVAGYAAVGVAATGSGSGGTSPTPSATAVGVLNAASFKGGAVAPGEIVTIFGANMGPAGLATLRLEAGRVATELEGARVLFDGVAAPVIYTLAGQGSVIVPYSLAGKASTQMVVEYQGRRSDPVTLPVTASAPGLFSVNSSGTGQGAIVNQNGTLNSAQNPAPVGSIVVLYGTGEGAVTPSVADGTVNSAVFPKPVLPVTVTVAGRNASIAYAGAAPSLVAGVFQANIEIPGGLTAGNQPVVVNVGGVSSQAGITVAVAGSGTAPVPVIEVTPASVDFGTVTVGQPASRTITVRNAGTGPLNITFVSSSNPLFTPIDSFPPFTLAPGESRAMTFRFSPTGAGPQTGTITVSSNDPARPSVTINATGTGAATGGGSGGAGGMTVLTFDITGLGNGGTVPQGYGDNVTAPVMGNFSYGGQASTPNVTVQYLSKITGAGSDLQFWSNGYGDLRNVLFNDPDPDTGYRVVLTAAAGSTVTLNSFDMGSFGTLTLPGLQVLDANGAAVFSRTNVSVPSTGHQTFTGPWTSTTLTIVVNTTGLGGDSDNVALDNISFTESGGSAGGGGGSQTPAIEVTPAALDFGSVAAGQVSTRTITARNTGTGPLTVSFVSSSNALFTPADSFPPFTLQPGESRAMTFRFSPTGAGPQTGTITISSNATARPSVTINVSGTGTAAGGGASTKQTLVNALGLPNNRTADNVPANAIDGSTATFTWTTPAFNNVAVSYLAVGLSAPQAINRIRLYKDNDSGVAGPVAKNLVIEYTVSDAAIPLGSRTWTTVQGLSNGFNGTELMVLNSISPNGAVTGDNHVSATNGWASLVFTPVSATGIRIGFSNPASFPRVENHYRVYEFEVYGPGGGGGTGGLPTITFGQTINGTLAAAAPGRSKDCGQCYADVYQLTVTAARNIVITLNSTAFDAYISLLDSNGEIIGSNDDGGGGLNARLTGTIQPGVYRIEATSANAGETGAYTLAIAP